MTDSIAPSLTAERLLSLSRALAWQASEHGCYGAVDTNCVEAKPEEPDEWCPYCLMGQAAKAIPDLLADATARAQEIQDLKRGQATLLRALESVEAQLAAHAQEIEKMTEQLEVARELKAGYIARMDKAEAENTLLRQQLASESDLAKDWRERAEGAYVQIDTQAQEIERLKRDGVKALEQLRLANLDAATNEADANALRELITKWRVDAEEGWDTANRSPDEIKMLLAHADDLEALLSTDLPDAQSSLREALKDAAEIRSSYGFLLMRLAVAASVADAYNVCKREFEEHEAAFRRLGVAVGQESALLSTGSADPSKE